MRGLFQFVLEVQYVAPKQVRERGNFAGLTLSLHWLLCLISLSPTEKEKKKKKGRNCMALFVTVMVPVKLG